MRVSTIFWLIFFFPVGVVKLINDLRGKNQTDHQGEQKEDRPKVPSSEVVKEPKQNYADKKKDKTVDENTNKEKLVKGAKQAAVVEKKQPKSTKKPQPKLNAISAEKVDELLNRLELFGIFLHLNYAKGSVTLYPYCNSKFLKGPSSDISEQLDLSGDKRTIREFKKFTSILNPTLIEQIKKTKRIQLYYDQLRKSKNSLLHEKVLMHSPFKKQEEYRDQRFNKCIYVGDEFLKNHIKQNLKYYSNLASELIEYRDWNFEQYCRCLFVERLCSVKGISVIMALDLRDKFETFDNVSTASEKSLCEIDGIGPGLAKRLINQKFPTRDELVAEIDMDYGFKILNPVMSFSNPRQFEEFPIGSI